MSDESDVRREQEKGEREAKERRRQREKEVREAPRDPDERKS